MENLPKQKSKFCTISLSEGIYKRLGVIAAKFGYKRAAVVSRLLESWLRLGEREQQDAMKIASQEPKA